MLRTTITEEQARKILNGTDVLVFTELSSLDDMARPYLYDDGDGETVWERDIPDIEIEDFPNITAWVLEKTLSAHSNVYLTAWINDVCIWRRPIVLATPTVDQILAALEK